MRIRMDGGKFFGAFRACSGQPDIRHACTVMHEREIVFGGEGYEEALACLARLMEERNVVIGQGIKLAKQMKKAFGVPYLEVDYPYGLEGTREFIEAICERLHVDVSEKKLDIDADELRIIAAALAEAGKTVMVIGCDPMAIYAANNICKEPMSELISRAEIHHKTVLEYAPNSEIADIFRTLVLAIFKNEERIIPEPLSDDELDEIYEEIDVLIEKMGVT